MPLSPSEPRADLHLFPARLASVRELLEAHPAQALAHLQSFCIDDPREGVYALLLSARAHYRQGQLEDALSAAEKAQQDAVTLDDPLAALELRTLLGRIAHATGNFETAAVHFEHALGFARQLQNIQHELDLLNLQAGISSDQGDYPQALRTLGHVLSLLLESDLLERQGTVLSNMGTLHTLLGDYPQALEHLKEAYTILHDCVPGSRSEATNLLSLGSLYQEMGNESEALHFFSRVRDLGQSIQDPQIEAAALNNMANSYLEASDFVGAEHLFSEALALTRRVGLRQFEIDNLDGLGQVYIACGDIPRAAERHREALSIARAIGDPEGEIDALLNLGRDALKLGEPRGALASLQESLALAEQLGRQPSVFCAHELLAEAHETLGDLPLALKHYRAFHETEKRVFNAENERRTRQLSAHLDLERARHDAEEERLRSEVLKLARDEAEDKVKERTRELEEAQLEIVTRLAVAAEYRDDNTGEHTKRVGRNAAAIAYALGWSDEDIELLFVAARLHDVGKIGVPDSILHKPGRLSETEIDLMRTHAEIGARILSAGNSRLLQLAEEVAQSHHEQWSGRGYPHGLAGEAIPQAARIVAVADVLDALTHARPYKSPWSVVDALAELDRQSARHFDPEVITACLKVFGPGGTLSPLQTADDWPSTLEHLKRTDSSAQLSHPS